MMLRPLSRVDGEALHELERAANDFPWSRQQFIDSLAGNDFGWAVERDGELVGFALFSQILDEATLLNILVRAESRRAGLARQLLLAALAELTARGARRCLLEVRAGNGPAIGLYRSLGFQLDGRRRDYYPAVNGREDALLMSRDLPEQEQEIE